MTSAGVELQIMPQAGEFSVDELVIADGSAEVRTNIAERADCVVAAKHKQVVTADPARELIRRFQFVNISDFNKPSRDVPPTGGWLVCHGCAYAAVAGTGLRSTTRIASKRLTGNPSLLSDVTIGRGSSMPV